MGMLAPEKNREQRIRLQLSVWNVGFMRRLRRGSHQPYDYPDAMCKGRCPARRQSRSYYQPSGARLGRDCIGECSAGHVANGADAVVWAQFTQLYAPLHPHPPHQAGCIICQS
ncbi:hypothetical protein D9N00_09495 [Pseudomonas syringae pv. actinidiae]|nr:hypothetical protein D9N00_09495 [Pseudomonas syringae pv. actinidiae]